ncbi:UPF0449 protein C19orf25 homolog [Anabrus simplex]|uniref:UPF0449 protein C19orf25 homolog n=1 Tax=Anabrus simplex TaxID=316456 RepID=UPI0034DDB7D8
MFKKKSNILPRPKPPANEFLVEDLENAPSDDVVFTLAPNGAVREVFPNSDSTVLFPGNGSDNTTSPEYLFQQVKSFVEVNRELKELMQKVELQNEALHTSDRELKSNAEDIRKQALSALK